MQPYISLASLLVPHQSLMLPVVVVNTENTASVGASDFSSG